ncbi:MAG TPA: molybdopterin-synthase adenylyltransferase MoeB [Herpetosiphonaceae bacterium]|nr:molybdopterin-synthase adenylyltransferase MoeB [Herpetosiphonaceae bacterium]
MTTATNTELTHEEIRRYSRHLIMPEVGPAGQRKLKQASVLLVGTGGLGAPLALYLAAAGVGHLGLVDFDVVDESNLQRQIIHGVSTLGKPKIESAKARIADMNPLVEVTTYNANLTSDNAFEILEPYDIIIDGTDNFPTRYLVNDACVLLDKPNVYGSIFRFEGQASVFAVKEGPCYRCLYPEPPPPGLVPSCAEGGVLGVLPGLIGTIQATEAIKLIIGQGTPLIGRLLLLDALEMRFRELKLRKNPDCPVCGTHPTVTELIDYQAFCGVSPQTTGLSREDLITPRELAETLAEGNGHRPLLLDVREPHEWDIVHLEDAKLIPVNALAGHLDELPRDQPIVVYCKTGNRSARATQLLKDAGFRKVQNLAGGITRWATEIDPRLPTY